MKNCTFLFLMFFFVLLGIQAQSVCIDPGHGGSDPGAVGCGLREANINLDVGQRFYNVLKNAGYKVYITRTSDVFVSLASRAQYANSLGVDRFISVHCNAFNGSAHGTETFCYPNSGNTTYRLRDKTNPEVVAALGTYNRGCKTADFYVLRETAMPAILCELAFIDNAGDAAKLGDAYYRQKAAEALKRGLANAGVAAVPAEKTPANFYIAPRFSLDGTQIVVSKPGAPKLYAVPVAGGKLVEFTQEQVAFEAQNISVFAEENEIFVEINGQKQQLTHGQDVFFSPVLSPDKKWVAFQGLVTGLYVAEVQGTKVIEVGQGNHACWTPDSQAIVLDVSQDNGQELTSSQLHIIKLVSPDIREILTSKTGLKAQRPSVSPDGTQVVFDSEGKIFITNLQQRGSPCTEVSIQE